MTHEKILFFLLFDFYSPDLRTSSAQVKNVFNQDDLSRRYSIDSYSHHGTGSMASYVPSISNVSSNVGSIMPFNRFSAISENEYEEPSINQKFLQMQDPSVGSNADRRLTTLQTRNLKQKPHLKSSYAIEMLPASENLIAGDKENRVQRRFQSKFNSYFDNFFILILISFKMSAVTQKTFNKRPHDGTNDPKPPKKSNR